MVYVMREQDHELGPDSQVETVHAAPELRDYHCSKYELRGFPKIACAAAKPHALISSASTAGSLKLTILTDSK